jgi:hypothetical protein
MLLYKIMSIIEQESLNNINIEIIDNEYAYGQYGEFKVIIMRKTIYINATKLCNVNLMLQKMILL